MPPRRTNKLVSLEIINIVCVFAAQEWPITECLMVMLDQELLSLQPLISTGKSSPCYLRVWEPLPLFRHSDMWMWCFISLLCQSSTILAEEEKIGFIHREPSLNQNAYENLQELIYNLWLLLCGWRNTLQPQRKINPWPWRFQGLLWEVVSWYTCCSHLSRRGSESWSRGEEVPHWSIQESWRRVSAESYRGQAYLEGLSSKELGKPPNNSSTTSIGSTTAIA